MEKSGPLDAYELSYQNFYAEIPSNLDYLNEIDPDIQDEHESDDDGPHGLSAEQVSDIARDSLNASRQTTSDTDSPQLFPSESQDQG